MHSDYVVIGAGSSGCVVAARLAEAGASVVLLEAGGWANRDAVRTPAFYPTLQDSEIDWAYRTLPQAGLDGRRMFLSRGKGIGGSSLMNALVYMRGNRGDYNAWRDQGNLGWSYDEVLPLFKRSERNGVFGEPFHGQAGPVSVVSHRQLNPLTELFMAACASVGLTRNDDVNGESQEGYGEFQMTADSKGRCGTDRAFLEPIRDVGNLTIFPGARVTRLLMEKGRVTGAEYFDGKSVDSAMADCEVILSAGSINTPQILMLSGIGPADHLAQMGLATAVDLPGVGSNLQDHILSALRCEISEPLSPYGMASRDVQAAVQAFMTDGSGPYASNFVEAGIFLRCGAASAFPDVQVHFVCSIGADVADGTGPDRHGFALYPYVTRPKSRGSVRLRTAHPMDPPAIDPAYFSDPADLRLTVEGLITCREVAMAEPFGRIGAREIRPGAEVTTRDDLAAYVRRSARTVWHPVGTCRMGADQGAVVDASLRLHGIEGLRVADASIMPNLVSGNTHAPCMMIGEKAADLILAR
jgi:choline dehydrogenase